MKKIGVFLIFVASLFTSACSKTLEVAANFPAYFSSQQINRDIEFGSKYGSNLDVYVPNDGKTSHPVIVFFYGGAWSMGHKETYRFAADAFTSRGYVVVIPDYIKYPSYKYPIWQEEAAKAVVWTHHNIVKYTGDTNQMFIMGHSAGAHIGAILVTDNEYLAKEGGNRNWIKAFAGLAGPYNFTPDEPDYMDMFGPEQNYPKMQVSNYVDGKQPPILLLWGKKDDVVGTENIDKLKVALDKKGGEYKVIYYDGVGHIGIVSALTPLGSSAPVEEDVDAWFKAHMAK